MGNHLVLKIYRWRLFIWHVTLKQHHSNVDATNDAASTMRRFLGYLCPDVSVFMMDKFWEHIFTVFSFSFPVFTSSLLKPDEQTGIRRIEQFKLVTET